MSNIVHKVKDAVTNHHDKPSHSTNAGPHDSNVANKVDPRVDSDRDHRAGYSAAGTGNTTAGTGISSGTGTTGTSYGAGTSGYDSTNTTASGPHGSNLANKADPRVDSDRGQYGTTGGVTAGGAYNSNPSSTNAGPHSSNLANKADPRVDSDLDNRARHQNLGSNTAPAGSSYTTPGSGGAQQTAGPHDSNIANKLDPRVDSDLDNSRTVGGNATRY
ncbi:cell surface protein, putative [Talaromyces stipitatus ATCC 10500]|uniref:Cell surface protein, putative n=1 Tax=Talaromyces stipitatus (strain ATCC 10500 / CBS 375.48 / QM 6759 / NRRL 1006) TaxID=441959 RepID=B8M150_TALSN|nr:cell surface protein, putative [Talaromyces stipitatus ATCC 10500]EED20992.1 cell surface protein, putative [Talaromyces stipitatus ATCC 10500]